MAPQLKAEEREVIAQRLAAGVTRKAIGAELHRSERTIRREIKANSIAGIYCAVQAQKLSEQRRRLGRAKCRKTAQPEVVHYLITGLRKFWSPDQIAGRSRVDFPDQPKRWVSRQLVYNWLEDYDHRQPLQKKLRRRWRVRRPRKPRLQVPTQALADRPAIVDQRGRDGDWEGDTIVGPGLAALISLVERRSGYLALLPTPRRCARPVRRAITGRLSHYPPEQRRSLTLDNGPEFTEEEELERALGLRVYHTQPHCPWQRGCIENLNGLIRQYCPKGTNFHDLSRYRIAQIEHSLNDRPRKRLHYQTPNEIFHQQCQRTIQT